MIWCPGGCEAPVTANVTNRLSVALEVSVNPETSDNKINNLRMRFCDRQSITQESDC